jgi:outer membrane protein insertion porin family
VSVLLAALAVAAAPALPVRSVRLEGGQSRFAKYLAVAPGAPYDPEAVRRSVVRLFATGAFEDVVVLSESFPDGIDLVFRGRPAPLLAGVQVSGDRVASRATLRRWARLRPGEALWPARLTEIEAELQAAFRAAGWLEATVAASARPVAGGADLLLRVAAGPRVRLRYATVRGAPEPLPLLGLMRPFHGDVYRRQKAEEAAERMRQHVARAGYFRAAVRLEETRAPGSALLDLGFVVEPGAHATLVVEGAELPRVRRNAVLDLLREGGGRPDALEAAAESLEEHFRAEGFRDVRVRPGAAAAEGGGEEIRLQVALGPRATVASVDVSGAPEGSWPTLKTRAGEALRDDWMEEDARTLRDALLAAGHPEARVDAEAKDGGGALPVVFRVQAGPQVTVEKVSVEAPAPPGEETVGELRTRAGAPYRARDVATDVSRLVSAYRNAGYLQAAVAPSLSFGEDGGLVEVVFKVTPGPRVQVGELVVAGTRMTRDLVVTREVEFERGDPLALGTLLESQRRLQNLGIFERVTVTPLQDEGETRDLVVAVGEAPATTVAYGIGSSERDNVRGSIELTRRNLFGMDRTLTAFARASLRGQRYVLSYREPYLLGRRRDVFLTAFFDDEDRTTFDFTRLGGFVQTARRLSPQATAIFRVTYQATEVFEVEVPVEEIDREFRTYTLAGPAASLVQDTRDDPLDARRGTLLGADLQLSSRYLGGASFVKGYFQAAHHRRVSRTLSVAFSGRVGLAATYGSEDPDQLPLPERFFAGGDYTLRGFPVDAVGPQEVGTGGELFPTGGNGLVLGSTEVRKDIGRALTVAGFVDAGNVYPLVGDIDLTDLRYSAGLGVRYRTALGPLRLDWGYKLNRREGESPHRFHLTIGNAF